MGIDGVGSGYTGKTPYANTPDKVSSGDFESRLKKAMGDKDRKELKKACLEFEQVFLSMMYKQMKATVPKSDLTSGDSGREIFEGMLDDKLTEEASQNGKLGLADMLYKQLEKQMDNRYEKADEGEKLDQDKK